MSTKTKARVFVPLIKVDEEQRLVYGRITQEILDKSGEVMDYETSKPHFEKWSSDIEEASGGLSKGNVRVMHGLSVAGKLTDIAFDDEAKAIDVCAKVVDDAEWNKVIEGCYTGFSVGGKYEKRWTDKGVKKFTAGPNEVSLVDNPCVPSATFSMLKADGAEEAVAFKVENDDDEWPDFAKADDTAAEQPAEQPATEGVQQELPFEPTNADVAQRAEKMAKAAGEGKTWADFIGEARAELIAEHNGGLNKSAVEKEAEEEDDKEAEEGDKEEKAEKVTPPGVSQKWETSDGKTFEKKAEAIAHEETLKKGEPTAADKLRERLNKATNPTLEADPELWDDFDRVAKVFNALTTPFGEDGQPKLEKGMYTINRFSNVLSDMASLSRCIKAEGKREGDDQSDSTISADIIAAVKDLGKSFIDYATNQVQELLAGMDDDVIVTHYDYYYNAAKEEGENQLAKDVCSIITEHRDVSRERREELGKAWSGMTTEDVPVISDEELSPALQKRFDDLQAENDEFKKIAEEAVTGLEDLTKRMVTLENQPVAPAFRTAWRPGDEMEFMGKTVKSEEDKVAVVKEMLEKHGPDAMATMLIKAAHAGGGHQLSLRK